MWDLIVSVPDHCLSFYFKKRVPNKNPIGIRLQRVVVSTQVG